MLKCSSVLEEWIYVKDFVRDNALPTNSLSVLWQTLAETFAEKKDEKGKVISPQKCGNLLILEQLIKMAQIFIRDSETTAGTLENIEIVTDKYEPSYRWWMSTMSRLMKGMKKFFRI